MMIKWEKNRVQNIIHYFTTVVPKKSQWSLKLLPATTHTYSKTPSPLNNIYSISLRTKRLWKRQQCYPCGVGGQPGQEEVTGLVQGHMKNQWQRQEASTGRLNCCLEPTTRPTPSLKPRPPLLIAVVRYFMHPSGTLLSAIASWLFGKKKERGSAKN